MIKHYLGFSAITNVIYTTWYFLESSDTTWGTEWFGYTSVGITYEY